MSTEQMRQAFETAYLLVVNEGEEIEITEEDMRNSRRGGEYTGSIASGAWWAWQASRAAVIVQMPQQSGANPDWNQAIRYCIQAVEAEGLGWKP